MKRTITQEFVLVTPAMAIEWLRKYNRPIPGQKNRNLSREQVLKIVRDIRSGKWEQRNVSIAFLADGRLGDGQHRLRAIALSGVACQCIVERGYPVDTKFDDNRSRRWSDNLTMRGEKNAKVVEAVTKMVICYAFSDPKTRIISGMEFESALKSMPEIREAVQYVRTSQPMRLKSAAFAAFYVICGYASQTRRDDFFEKLEKGAKLAPGNPILAMRNKLIQFSEAEWKGIRSNSTMLFNSMALAWSAMLKERTMHRFQMPEPSNYFSIVDGASPTVIMEPLCSVSPISVGATDADYEALESELSSVA